MVERRRRARNSLQAHYTRSDYIVSYMVSRLSVESRDVIWEPCAGEGHLIDAVLQVNPDARIIGTEIDEASFHKLRAKYKDRSNVSIFLSDALQFWETPLLNQDAQTITRVIANPPYGAWQEFRRRSELKQRFPNLYVKDSYAVFLYYALLRVENQGRLVFIIPETFLWLHRHEFLRRVLINGTTVEEITLFPSRFFPGIQFGYAGMCIITLRKCPPTQEHAIKVWRKLAAPHVLGLLARGERADGFCELLNVKQQTVASNPSAQLALPDSGGILRENQTGVVLGDVASIVTGFYSGCDSKWLRRAGDDVRGANRYIPISRSQIAEIMPGLRPIQGIRGERCFVPVVRGGAAAFVKPTRWYVDWSREAVSEYTRKGKNPARFQNASYYFRQGIAVPMVASGQVTAALLNYRLFDQGIVGVFPRSDKLLLYMLGFLNTRVATELLRNINPTANNSANYLKRLPFVIPTVTELESVNVLVLELINSASLGLELATIGALEELEAVIRRIWHGYRAPAS